jgi:hypothetical protein
MRKGRLGDLVDDDRGLDNGSEDDVRLTDGVSLWEVAFDHSQTRPYYHLHPLRLDIRRYGNMAFGPRQRRKAITLPTLPVCENAVPSAVNIERKRWRP